MAVPPPRKQALNFEGPSKTSLPLRLPWGWEWGGDSQNSHLSNLGGPLSTWVGLRGSLDSTQCVQQGVCKEQRWKITYKCTPRHLFEPSYLSQEVRCKAEPLYTRKKMVVVWFWIFYGIVIFGKYPACNKTRQILTLAKLIAPKAFQNTCFLTLCWVVYYFMLWGYRPREMHISAVSHVAQRQAGGLSGAVCQLVLKRECFWTLCLTQNTTPETPCGWNGF